jgi:hypothetical protein
LIIQTKLIEKKHITERTKWSLKKFTGGFKRIYEALRGKNGKTSSNRLRRDAKALLCLKTKKKMAVYRNNRLETSYINAR